MKILITETETLKKSFKEELDKLHLDYDVFESVDDIIDCAQYDVVFGGLIVKHKGLDALKNLKWIQVSSAGYNHLPVEMWKKQGIIVTNAKHVFSDPIAEHVLFYTLMHYKKGLEHLDLQKNKVFTRLSNKELEDEVVCILGTGSIAQAIATRFKSFHVKIIGVNTNGRLIENFDECYAMKDIKLALAKSDIVVMSLPLTDDTKYFFDESHFEAMKQGSMFINIGRGRIIDESALVKHLNNHHLAFAVLDVMETEPLPQVSELWMTKNLLITPHDSGVSDKTGVRLLKLFIENIECFQNNNPLHNRV